MHIIVRTRHLAGIDVVRSLGANEIVAEEFETSLGVLTFASRLFETLGSSIDRIVEGFRADACRPFWGGLSAGARQRLLRELAPEFELEAHRLANDSPCVGKAIGEVDLRACTVVMLLVVRCESALEAMPAAEFRLEGVDILLLAGNGSEMPGAIRMLTCEKVDVPQSVPPQSAPARRNHA